MTTVARARQTEPNGLIENRPSAFEARESALNRLAQHVRDSVDVAAVIGK